MNNFKDGGFKKRGKSFGGKPKFGGDKGGNRSGGNKFSGGKSDGRPAEMFKAECSTCHKTCSLPFKPSTDKPVYCSDCFAKKNADREREEGRPGSGRNEYTKPPRDERSPRHDRPQTQPNFELSAMKRQLETIEARLNRILDIINPPLPPVKANRAPDAEKVAVAKVSAKTTAPKTVKKVAPAKKVATKKTTAKKAVKKAVKKVTKAKK
jgi:CxxC-x17-CxxC domain-containing protein